MARKAHTPDAPGDIEIPGEDTIADAVAPQDQGPTVRPLRYVGPDYQLGIQMPGARTLIRPREFTPEQVDRFLNEFPERSTWWK